MLYCSLSYSLETVFSQNPELGRQPASPSDPPVPPLKALGVTRFIRGWWMLGLNSGPHDFPTSALTGPPRRRFLRRVSVAQFELKFTYVAEHGFEFPLPSCGHWQPRWRAQDPTT